MIRPPNRRHVLSGLGAWLLGGCGAVPPAGPASGSAVFRHGVASGDPGEDSIVLWTRISPDAARPTRVAWRLSTEPDFTRIAADGIVETGPDRDWTVKVDVSGLQPGTAYFYRFAAGGQLSAVGRTRTLPEGDLDRLRLAVVSCADHARGYFNVYDAIARTEGFDAVLHLGDYIYARGPGDGVSDAGDIAGRRHEPPWEALSLADYRARHAQYKTDTALQAMHAAHPVIAIWDDHEIADAAWARGAGQHDAGRSGPYAERRRAAMRAYHEWMPVREPPGDADRAARSPTFRFGGLASLSLMETRLNARARPFLRAELPALLGSRAEADRFLADLVGAADREKIGGAQLRRLRDAFVRNRREGTGWTLLGNPTLMTPVRTPEVWPFLSQDDARAIREGWRDGAGFLVASRFGLPLSLDAWDGYPAERARLLAAIREEDVGPVLVLTGDSHAWWVNEIPEADGCQAGVELAVASVTAQSPFSDRLLGGRGRDLELLLNRENPHVRFVSGQTHGYIDLELGTTEAVADFKAVSTVRSRRYRTFTEARFRIRRDGRSLRVTPEGGLSLAQSALFL
jgi:phosphodiesterase/alkaline phosphatase D-like protein